MLWNVNS